MNVNSGLLTLVQGGACGEEPWPVGGLGVCVCWPPGEGLDGEGATRTQTL